MIARRLARLAGKLSDQTVKVLAKAGDAGRLFGSITTSDVSKAAAEQLGLKLDRRDLELPEVVKELGTFPVVGKLHPEVSVDFQIEVADE